MNYLSVAGHCTLFECHTTKGTMNANTIPKTEIIKVDHIIIIVWNSDNKNSYLIFLLKYFKYPNLSYF